MIQQSTLKKLSEVLGLSISTVSRALKDHPDISEKTKARVKELATAMEYEPNSFAVQLRTKHNKVLGILVPTINNFFYDSFIAAVEEEARVQGYSVLIMQSRDDLEIEKNNLNLFRKNQIAGLFASISIGTEDLGPFAKMQELNIPVVFCDRVPVHAPGNKVCMADTDSARMAAETIIKKGKKNVLALFGHPKLSITQKRLETFKESFATRAPNTKITYGFPEHAEPSRLLVLEQLDGNNRPDVIFCMGDLILMGVMYAIHAKKLRVPEDIAVISISNGLLPNLYDPKITHIETSGYKLGKQAFLQMMASLQNPSIIEEVVVDSVLIEGGSI
ncbi:MAG: hypothetical protein RLZZ28_22 [Bacteroidota bacterium]